MEQLIGLLEWSGCFLGLFGALLLAVNSSYSAWGWVLFLMSNAAWIAFGLITGATGLVVMQAGFTVTSLIGIWRWLICFGRAPIHKNG